MALEEIGMFGEVIVNGLIGRSFLIRGFWEDLSGDATAEPGSWVHYAAYAVPFLRLWSEYAPA